MSVNPCNVIHLLSREFGSTEILPVTEREKEVARQVSELLNSYKVANVEFEEENELVFENELYAEDGLFDDQFREIADEFLQVLQPPPASLPDSTESQDVPSSSSWTATPSTPTNRDRRKDIPFSKRKQAVNFWRSAKKKKRKPLSSVQNQFRYVLSIRQLESWESQMERDGPVHEKLYKIAENVRKKFCDSRLARKSIHDVDIRRWALLESRHLTLPNFVASKEWIRKFKNANRIVSRKVTKFVCHGASEHDDNIAASARVFVNRVALEIPSYGPENVFNTDQSGFSLEMHGGRTLEEIGTRRVEAQAQSMSATTHSYTIMPTISAAGKLLSPLVIVFKEVGGKFGPVVEQTMLKPSNIFSMAGKSSIMGMKEIKLWYENIFLPNVGNSSLLLVDSLKAYSSFKDSSPGTKLVELRIIPPHTTGIIQPLDVFFFRIWKTFCRKISEFVVLEDANIFLRQRDNIIRMQSLVHNQLSAPRFLSFRQYSWFKSQYFNEEPPPFVHPISFCFMTSELDCSECTNIKLLKCSWCDKCLCIKHAFIDLHLHTD